jgi:hypothetical protein
MLSTLWNCIWVLKDGGGYFSESEVVKTNYCRWQQLPVCFVTIESVLVVHKKGVNSMIPGTQRGYGSTVLTCHPNSEQVTVSNGLCNYYIRFQMFMW